MGRGHSDTLIIHADIERQTADILDANPEIDAPALVGQIDVSHWLRDDEYPGWHTTTEMEPMVRALFLREPMDCRSADSPYTKTDHERRLRDPDVAEQLLIMMK